MADKKTTAKVVKAEEVKTLDQLLADLETAQIEHTATRRSHLQGELVNPRVLGAHRKTIARIKTAINAAKAAGKESK